MPSPSLGCSVICCYGKGPSECSIDYVLLTISALLPKFVLLLHGHDQVYEQSRAWHPILYQLCDSSLSVSCKLPGINTSTMAVCAKSCRISRASANKVRRFSNTATASAQRSLRSGVKGFSFCLSSASAAPRNRLWLAIAPASQSYIG